LYYIIRRCCCKKDEDEDEETGGGVVETSRPPYQPQSSSRERAKAGEEGKSLINDNGKSKTGEDAAERALLDRLEQPGDKTTVNNEHDNIGQMADKIRRKSAKSSDSDSDANPGKIKRLARKVRRNVKRKQQDQQLHHPGGAKPTVKPDTSSSDSDSEQIE
jgi:hypothetical protein